MTKVLAETVGDGMLWNSANGEVIEAHRPCVVTREGYVTTKVALGHVRILGALKDTVSDVDFVQYVKKAVPKEGDKLDMGVVVQAFLKEHGEDQGVAVKAGPEKTSAAKDSKPAA